MNHTKLRTAGFVALLILGSGAVSVCRAGHAMKWEELPEPVRATILANGGTAGQPVDRENGKKEGKLIFEAGVKDKDGKIADLVVLEDGKLFETKHDDESNFTDELAYDAKKVMKFSHSRRIDNPYLPLASLQQDILEGTEGAKKVRIERTAMPDKHKTFEIAGQKVEAFAVEDREWENGELSEVAMDYFAQDDAGNVYYLGEDVDEYTDGKISSHEGSWLLGKDTQNPGVMLPGNPKVGDKFKSEDVSKEINEDDDVTSLTEDVVLHMGTYQNCIKVREHLSDGTTEYKYYAKGIGCVREVPSVGDVRLISHKTK